MASRVAIPTRPRPSLVVQLRCLTRISTQLIPTWVTVSIWGILHAYIPPHLQLHMVVTFGMKDEKRYLNFTP